MDAPAPPPDFNEMSQNLAALSAQIARVTDMPAVVGVQALQARLDQLFARQDQQHREVIGRLDDVTHSLNQLQEGQEQLPMRLHNATATLDGPIHYPEGVEDDELPRTKQELLQIGARRATQVSRALGLPALPRGTPVVERRQQIIDYLGCRMVAT